MRVISNNKKKYLRFFFPEYNYLLESIEEPYLIHVILLP